MLKSRTSSDQIGRVTLTETSEDGSSYSISSESVYKYKPSGQNGMAVRTRNPHRSAAESTDGWTRTTQDVLGRVTEVATFTGGGLPPETAGSWNGRVLTSYNAHETTVTDQDSKSRRSRVDGLGRLIRVTEDPSGLNYETTMATTCWGIWRV